MDEEPLQALSRHSLGGQVMNRGCLQGNLTCKKMHPPGTQPLCLGLKGDHRRVGILLWEKYPGTKPRWGSHKVYMSEVTWLFFWLVFMKDFEYLEGSLMTES
jgi:hypothetical protein